MEDFSALAQRISAEVREVRGCLILSRDGLVLGADPVEAEAVAKPAWLKFVTLGDPERSFIEFPDQVWAYVRRGSYAAFAVAAAGCRPGILVDQLEQALFAAEQARARPDTLRVPDVHAAPSGKPRSHLHPAAGRSQPVDVAAESPRSAEAQEQPLEAERRWRKRSGAEPAEVEMPAEVEGTEADPPVPEPSTVPPPEDDSAAPGAPSSTLGREPKRLLRPAQNDADSEGEVDRVLLAKEFSGLLQVDSDDDEGST
jgi:hypothetical protein